MQSKKLLQTTPDMFDADPWEPGKSWFVWSNKAIMELEHDARLAHEMLPVLRNLRDAARRGLRECSYQSRAAIHASLAAVAPFLED